MLEIERWLLGTREISDVNDEVVRYGISSIIRPLQYSVQNSLLYWLKDEALEDWLEVTKCQLKQGNLVLMFREIQLRVVEELQVSHAGEMTTKVVNGDEYGASAPWRPNLVCSRLIVSPVDRDMCNSAKIKPQSLIRIYRNEKYCVWRTVGLGKECYGIPYSCTRCLQLSCVVVMYIVKLTFMASASSGHKSAHGYLQDKRM